MAAQVLTCLRHVLRAQQLTSLSSFHPPPQWACARLPHCYRRWATAASSSSGAELAAATAAAAAIDEQTAGDTAASAGGTDEPLSPGLYLVSTPIGNLEDITLRALRVLRTATLVLAEDTRHTQKLFSRFGIRTPLQSYHQHNERQKEGQILRQLQQGAAIALVSDAGTPAINDPGADLVAAAAAAGLPVIPVPGPSALLAAVVASGLPTDHFLYCGFTAPKSGARQKQFAQLVGQEATLVFFVSPHSLLAALQDAGIVLGGHRRCCLARELTKRHEEFWRGTLQEALAEFTQRGPRGEFVLLIEGCGPGGPGAAAGGSGTGASGEVTEQDIVAALRVAVAAGESPSSAARSVAKRLGQNRKQVYALSLTLGEQQEQGQEEEEEKVS